MTRALLLTTLLLAPGLAAAQGDGLPLDLRNNQGRQPSYPAQLGRVGAGVTLAGVARGALDGNPDAVQDALGEPLTPEFLVHIAMFDASLRGAGAVLNRIPVEGRIASALKGNLAMAAAVTLASAVDVDLNGFTYGDLARGDLEKLAEASVGLRPISGEEVATTVGSYAAAGGTWSLIKRGAAVFGRRAATRFARTAVIKGALAVAPVPGTRVAAAALTVGETLLAVGDLAVILVGGGLVEEQVREVRAAQKAESAIEEARRRLAEQAAAGDPAAVAEALAQTSGAYDEERNRHYRDLAMEDLALVRRLRRDGADGAALEGIARDVFADYGARLALPAQTAALIEAYGEDRDGHVERQQRRAERAARERAAEYREEAAFYRQLKAQTRDLAVREQLERAAQDVEALATIGEGLFARIAKPAFAHPAEVEPARASITQALGDASDWDE